MSIARHSRIPVVAALTVALALLAAVPASASNRKARPSQAQAIAMAQSVAASAAKGVGAVPTIEVERFSASCGEPFGMGPRSINCAYVLYVHNTVSGIRQTCIATGHVTKSRKDGHVYARYGGLNCF